MILNETVKGMKKKTKNNPMPYSDKGSGLQFESEIGLCTAKMKQMPLENQTKIGLVYKNVTMLEFGFNVVVFQ